MRAISDQLTESWVALLDRGFLKSLPYLGNLTQLERFSGPSSFFFSVFPMTDHIDFADGYRTCYQRTFDILTAIEAKGGWTMSDDAGMAAAKFSFEFLYHTVAIDGSFAEDEYDLVNAVFGEWESFEERKSMAEHILQSTPNFLYEVPLIVAQAARQDQLNASSTAAELTSVIELMATIVQACDGNVTEKEIRTGTEYVARIRHFLRQMRVEVEFDLSADKVDAPFGQNGKASAVSAGTKPKELTEL